MYLTSEMIANIRRLAPNAIIGSFYGATETQRAVGYFEIDNDPTAAQLETLKTIPLGRGIKDVQLLVLNRSRQLAGVGELGEIYVRSPHLAEGYVGDKTLTRERFVTNPFTNDPQDRLYRSGELGRYLPDGNVEWAGRDDRRVNIRGFRVELEEVEFVLRQHPAVKDAAIVLCQFEQDDFLNQIAKIKNPKSDRCLVAYVAADEDQIALADLLHGYLSFRLPDYMVPSHYVVVEQLPLNPNGKIDHRALPAVQQFLSPQSRLIEAPQNELEAKICAIFCQVLSREQVGIRENFFRIGGHSLLAAQAMARIREAFGVGFELRTFLESPSVVSACKRGRTSTKTSRHDTEHGGYGSRADRAVTIADFVSHLQSLDVRLSAEGERLRLNAPQGVLTDRPSFANCRAQSRNCSFSSAIIHRQRQFLLSIVRRTTGNPAPLSFAQERLWFLEQLEPGSPVYNLCRAYRLMGKLNIFALELSLNEIVRRHEVLRSAIRIADGRPLQVTEPPHELKLSVRRS